MKQIQLTQQQEKKLNQIRNYKGNVIARWKWEVPATEKEALVMLRKALRLFYRAIDCHFLTTELYSSLKDYVIYIAKKASVIILAHPEIITGINEVKAYQHDNAEYEICQEKFRKKEYERCSLCKTPLVWPAYVIKRRNDKILSVSKPIGIKCLNGFVGKLKDLVSTFDIEKFEVEKAPTASTTTFYKQQTYKQFKQLSLF